MIEGTKIVLNGTEYVCPALNFSSVNALKEDIAIVSRGEDEGLAKVTESVARLIHAALKRNYPDITIETVMEGLDMNNKALAMSAVMGATPVTDRVAHPSSAERPNPA
jgi:hypothetical protein